MPNYTTSYSTNKKPRLRSRNGGKYQQLPSARRASQRRPGAQYLHHSQGFGRKRPGSRGGRPNARRPYAIIAVGCAALLFVASVVWYLNRSVDITLNDETVGVRINSSIETLITDQGLDSLKAGNLLAVDDSVLERGGGERYDVVLDGKSVSDDDLATTKLTGGEELTIKRGKDTYEEHDVQATVIEPTITVDGTGAIQYVKTWGVPGRSEVWVGKTSGITQDRGVVQEVVNCEVVCRSVTPSGNDKYVAITFDDGPSSYTQQILDILAEKGVSATFFLSGASCEGNPAAAKAIVDAGHEVGSNTYSDTSLADLSDDDLRSQITRGLTAVKDATGTDTVLVRAPFGQFSEKNWTQAMDLVGVAVSWNVDSGDWLLQGSQSVIDTVLGSVRSGNIVLLTDSEAVGAQTVEALPGLIDGLKEKGYEIVTLSALMETDETLAEELPSLTKVSMPEGAVLPVLSGGDDASESDA